MAYDKKTTPIEIGIDGTTIPHFKEIKLSQPINDHHQFELTLDIEAAEAKDAHTIDKSKNWPGKSIVIWFGDNLFVGIITHMAFNRQHDANGLLVISGYSKTYLLESAPGLYSWTDKSLRQIVNSLLEPAGIKAKVSPEFDKVLEYQCQYMESNFHFIQRLAKQYHEWLYYDGQHLVFGKPEPPEAIALEYGSDLETMEICMETLARPESAFFYHSMNVERHASQSPNSPSGLNLLGQVAFKSSMEVFQRPANRYTPHRVRTKSDLDKDVKKSQESRAAASHYITATSHNHNLKVGSMIDVSSAMQKKIDLLDTQIVGSFMITEITHHVSEGSYYYNTFKAIPSVAQSLPTPDVELPVAQTQIATVLSNQDPEGKGRVRVKMQWQINNMQTAWLRVMSPDAGSSSEVAQNRGFVFVPEEGDEVLINFRYQDPNRPFVMGSLYNGRNTSGGGQNNSIKSIITRSGHQIVFNDTPNGESITIKDKKNNTVRIDTANDDIFMEANRSVNIKAGQDVNIVAGKNMNIDVTENMNTSIGGDSIISIGKDYIKRIVKDYRLMASNIFKRADKNIESESDSLLRQSTNDVKTSSSVGSVKFNAGKEILNNSGESSSLF